MAFADLEDVEDRLDFSLDEAFQRMALAALEDASELARYHGKQNWPDHAAPRIVTTIVLNVVARYLRNPDGYVTSRAGDETVSWSDLRGELSLRFTDDEKDMLLGVGFGTKKRVGSVGVYAHRRAPLPADVWVPVEGRDELFPFLAKEDYWSWRP